MKTICMAYTIDVLAIEDKENKYQMHSYVSELVKQGLLKQHGLEQQQDVCIHTVRILLYSTPVQSGLEEVKGGQPL